eukprot:12470507-Alexandrium_andersonii.AAC.1
MSGMQHRIMHLCAVGKVGGWVLPESCWQIWQTVCGRGRPSCEGPSCGGPSPGGPRFSIPCPW